MASCNSKVLLIFTSSDALLNESAYLYSEWIWKKPGRKNCLKYHLPQDSSSISRKFEVFISSLISSEF